MDLSQSNYLIQALAHYTDSIRDCIIRMPPEMLQWQPDANEWSVQMVLAHLLHCEVLMQQRLAKIASEDNPLVLGFGPEEAPPYSDKPAYILLDDLEDDRKKTLSQIYTYSTSDWERRAVHSVQGETTLKEQIENIVHHDTEHLGQMYDLCEMWQTQRNHEELT